MSIKFCCKTSLPGGLLFVSEFIGFMIASKDILASQRLKCSFDIFFKDFANKFSSSSYGSSLGVEFHNFFCRFKNLLRIARKF